MPTIYIAERRKLAEEYYPVNTQYIAFCQTGAEKYAGEIDYLVCLVYYIAR
jgi:hypothetical protein